MNNRPFLLLLTAGSWAEAASTYRVLVPVVALDGPPTAGWPPSRGLELRR